MDLCKLDSNVTLLHPFSKPAASFISSVGHLPSAYDAEAYGVFVSYYGTHYTAKVCLSLSKTLSITLHFYISIFALSFSLSFIYFAIEYILCFDYFFYLSLSLARSLARSLSGDDGWVGTNAFRN